ncbi:MAG: MBL fold metallo-hydrolase [Brevinematia bacterium]
MEVEVLVLGEFFTNSYIVWNDYGGIIFDPGYESDLILKKLRSKDLNLEYVINTHGHFDHILGNNLVIKETSAKLGINKLDADMIIDPIRNLSSYILGIDFRSIEPNIIFQDGSKLSLGDEEFLCIHTPGHTPGSSCFYFPKSKVAFTGDTLFKFSYGRTDLPGGDQNDLLESLKRLKDILPDDVVCFPGHGESFMFGEVREWLEVIIEKGW